MNQDYRRINERLKDHCKKTPSEVKDELQRLEREFSDKLNKLIFGDIAEILECCANRPKWWRDPASGMEETTKFKLPDPRTTYGDTLKVSGGDAPSIVFLRCWKNITGGKWREDLLKIDVFFWVDTRDGRVYNGGDEVEI